MAVELALDFGTRDLVIAPNKDLDIRTGQSTVDQRIRVRLWIIQGEWTLDPTGNRLGSRLRDALRLPSWRAVQEVPLIVREALEDMDDIRVMDVQCEISPDTRKLLDMTIYYSMEDQPEEILSTIVTVEG